MSSKSHTHNLSLNSNFLTALDHSLPITKEKGGLRERGRKREKKVKEEKREKRKERKERKERKRRKRENTFINGGDIKSILPIISEDTWCDRHLSCSL